MPRVPQPSIPWKWTRSKFQTFGHESGLGSDCDGAKNKDERMRLTLIYPSVGRKENRPYVRAWQMQPLSMALLAGLTPPDVDVRFYDDRMEDIPFDEPTDLVALSVETFTALRAYKIARQFRARGVPVVLGGYHVTLLPDEAAREADAIVVGDAEPVWHQLLDDARRRDLRPV